MSPRKLLRPSFFIALQLISICLHQTTTFLVQRSLEEYPKALCTDGTHASYYHTWTDSPDQLHRYRNYVIFLQGGGYCHTVDACHFRCNVAEYLCTAWASSAKENSGILSDDPEVNPGFHDFYKVEVPYCTGDMYIGRRDASEKTDGFSFLGREVFKATVESLVNNTNIEHADNVILSGSSAGGAGVAFNCDYLKTLLPRVKIWCVVDAAFFYPVQAPFRTGPDCDDPIDVVLNSGATLWNAPEVASFSLKGWWAGIQERLFIGIAKFDRFGVESYCGNTTDKRDLSLWGPAVVQMARDLTTNYPDVGLFMPGCVYHMMLTDDRVFNHLRAGKLGLTYAETLQFWVGGSGPYKAWDRCWKRAFCNAQCKRGGPEVMVLL